MKKIYQAPNTKLVSVKLTKMIANSIPDVGFKDGKINESSDIGSRRSSIWEDEDEDYYE